MGIIEGQWPWVQTIWTFEVLHGPVGVLVAASVTPLDVVIPHHTHDLKKVKPPSAMRQKEGQHPTFTRLANGSGRLNNFRPR